MERKLIYDPGTVEHDSPAILNIPFSELLGSGESYLPDPGLKMAVNAALKLRQPLLLNGDPGVGKTALARSLATSLKYPLETVFASSEMSKQDLFYDFDHLTRMFDANTNSLKGDKAEYMTFKGLGKAILWAGGPKEEAKSSGRSGADRSFEDLATGRLTFKPEPLTSVVLIDEIDKAPRDLLNDILNQIEDMFFEVPELELTVRAPAQHRPIVILTSNSEKSLPGPFLRRCVFYHIPFPPLDKSEQREGEDGPTIADIVSKHISQLDPNSPLLKDAIAIFRKCREQSRGFSHKPSTAELLNWLLLLVEDSGLDAKARLRDNPDALMDHMSVLTKHSADQEHVKTILETWLKGS